MLSALLQQLPAIVSGFKGKNLKGQKRAAGEMENLANAQYNMDNPLYQRLYGQNQDAGQRDLASTIAEISRQNRKLQTMGRTPLLDQERGGESIFRQLIMGQQDVGERSRENTFSQLRGAQGSMAGVYDAQNDLANNMYFNDQSRVTGYHNLGEALKGLFGLNGIRGTTY